MKLPLIAAAAAISLCAPAIAQSEDIWQPCFASDASMGGVIAAFQAEGWAFPTSNEAHIDNLKTVAEPLFSVRNLPNVKTGAEYDRHIQTAHDRAEALLIDAATLQRDGLAVAIEHNDEAGGMIRCTIAGTDFKQVADAFDSRPDDIKAANGHETLADTADITLYRLEAPADATVTARAPFAAIAMRRLQ